MESFYSKLKLASYDVIYNIYDPFISNDIIETVFFIIQIIQNLSMTICDGV
jgi:hypothetical protein